MKFLNNVDLAQNELRNFVFQVLASAPSSPKVGQGYFDSTQNRILTFNGSTWTLKATDSDLLNGLAGTSYLNRANHTGTQASSTISDLAATVRGYTLDTFAAPVAAVAFNGQRATGLADPVNPQDAATMNWTTAQIQSAVVGIDSKPSVRVVVVANVSTLSGLQNFDGLTGVAGDRVLLTAQTTATQNGLWIMQSGAWTRSAAANDTITPGAFWMVEEGAVYAKSQWRCNNTGTVTVGTTALNIQQFGQMISYTASNGVQLVGANFSIILATNSGLIADSSGLRIDTTVVNRKYSASIGDGTSTSITVTHNLGTQDVLLSMRDTSNNACMTDWLPNTVSTVVLNFAVAPAANAYRVTITA